MESPPAATLPLIAYLDHLVEELRRLVPLALRDWDHDAIHHSRVATRRLKAGLDLFRPVLSDDARRPFAKVTRRLRRRLGPLRDLDVMLGHLDELSKGRHASAVAWLTGQLNTQREKARGESLEEAPPTKVLAKLSSSWAAVRDELVESAEAIDSLLVDSIHLQLDAFAERAERLIGASTQVQPATTAPLDVHELRIAGKALRYTLEMARAHGRRLDSRVTRTFKRMQDALGLWHDFVVVTEWAMRASLEGLVAHHDTKLQADVLALARLTLSRAEQRLSKFATLWAEEGRALAQTIRASFPITKPSPPTVSGTGPDPSATAQSSGAVAPQTDAVPAA